MASEAQSQSRGPGRPVHSSLPSSSSTITPSLSLSSSTIPLSSSTIAASVSSVGMVASRQLGGHRDSVLCVQAGRGIDTQHMLLSGSEDATVRVWDLRTNRAVRCIRAFDNHGVSSVRFGNWNGHECPYTIYATAAQTLSQFDLRSDKSVIISTASTCIRAASDDINQVSVSNSGLWAVCCDDSGEARLLGVEHRDISTTPSSSLTTSSPSASAGVATGASSSAASSSSSTSSSSSLPSSPAPSSSISSQPVSDLRVLRSIRAHDNICSTASFRPRATGQLATGGMDSSVAIWDYTKGKLLSRLSTAPPPGTTPSGQMFNPPFIHSIDWSADGSLLASGLGSSEVCLFSVPHGDTAVVANAKECGRLRGHHAAVAALEWAPMGNGNEWLVSGGNDRCLLLWDMVASMESFQKNDIATRSSAARKKLRQRTKTKPTSATSGTTTPTSTKTVRHETKSSSGSNGNGNNDSSSMYNGIATVQPRRVSSLQASFSTDELPLLDGHHYVRQRILHAAKPNWITTSPNGWMFVADPSANITCYSLV